jgi:hypothetical protein
MMPDHEDSLLGRVGTQATPPACRRFGFMLLGGLPVAGLIWLLLVRFKTGGWVWPVSYGFALAGLILGVSALLAPGWARRLYIGWHMVTGAFEKALTWVVLALVFWLVITPVGLFRRRRAGSFRSSPVLRKKSCWQEPPPVEDLSRYYRQF